MDFTRLSCFLLWFYFSFTIYYFSFFFFFFGFVLADCLYAKGASFFFVNNFYIQPEIGWNSPKLYDFYLVMLNDWNNLVALVMCFRIRAKLEPIWKGKKYLSVTRLSKFKNYL